MATHLGYFCLSSPRDDSGGLQRLHRGHRVGHNLLTKQQNNKHYIFLHSRVYSRPADAKIAHVLSNQEVGQAICTATHAHLSAGIVRDGCLFYFTQRHPTDFPWGRGRVEEEEYICKLQNQKTVKLQNDMTGCKGREKLRVPLVLTYFYQVIKISGQCV